MSDLEKHSEEEEYQTNEAVETPTKKSWGKRKAAWLIIILILLIGALGIFIWKEIEVSRYAKDLNRQQIYYQGEVDRVLNEERQHFLSLIMKPLVWAIRTEMIEEDYPQINQYLTNFVQKEENAQLLLVVDAEGTILSSTDKKLEGSEFSRHYNDSYLQANDVQVQNLDGNRQIVTAPIVNYNSRIGSLILLYIPNEHEMQYQRE